jgi:hypothetical protein
VVAQLPDYEWSEVENDYRPVVRNMERLTVSTFSEWHPCSTDLEDILLTASFTQSALQQPGTTVVVALGIEISSYPVSGLRFIARNGGKDCRIIMLFYFTIMSCRWHFLECDFKYHSYNNVMPMAFVFNPVDERIKFRNGCYAIRDNII